MSWSSVMEVHCKSFTQIGIPMPFWGKFFLQSSLDDNFLWNYKLNYFNANTRTIKIKISFYPPLFHCCFARQDAKSSGKSSEDIIAGIDQIMGQTPCECNKRW